MCVNVMVEELESYLAGDTGLREVVIAVVDAKDFEAFRTRLEHRN